MEVRKVVSKKEINLLSKTLAKYSSEVKLAFLFGSRATGREGRLSDYDFGIVVRKDVDLLELLPKLIVDLAQTLKVKEDLIDVVVLNYSETPIELVFKAAWKGIPLYYDSREELREFKVKALNMYLDYKILIEKHRLKEKFFKKILEENG